jgi:hypothetical protein
MNTNVRRWVVSACVFLGACTYTSSFTLLPSQPLYPTTAPESAVHEIKCAIYVPPVPEEMPLVNRQKFSKANQAARVEILLDHVANVIAAEKRNQAARDAAYAAHSKTCY